MTLIAAINTRDGLVIATDRRSNPYSRDALGTVTALPPAEVGKLHAIGDGYVAAAGRLPDWFGFHDIIRANVSGRLDAEAVRGIAVSMSRNYTAGMGKSGPGDFEFSRDDESKTHLVFFYRDSTGKSAIDYYTIVISRSGPPDAITGEQSARCDLRQCPIPGALGRSYLLAWGSGRTFANALRQPGNQLFPAQRADHGYRRFVIDSAPIEDVSAEEATAFLRRYVRDFVDFGWKAYFPSRESVSAELDVVTIAPLTVAR